MLTEGCKDLGLDVTGVINRCNFEENWKNNNIAFWKNG